MNDLTVVRFRDAKDDFGGVAELVDEAGAVVITRHGRPAYVLANYDDVTVNEECECGGEGSCCRDEKRSGHGHGHGGHGHGGHRHGHGGHGGHGHGGHGHGRGKGKGSCGCSTKCDCGDDCKCTPDNKCNPDCTCGESCVKDGKCTCANPGCDRENCDCADPAKRCASCQDEGCECGSGKCGCGKGDGYSANTGNCDCGADKGACDCGRHDPSGTVGDSTGGGFRPNRPSGTPGDSGPAHGSGCGCGGHGSAGQGGATGDAHGHRRGPRRPGWQHPNERHADRRRREWEDDPRSKDFEWAERKIREFERAARKRHEGEGPIVIPGLPEFLPTEFVGVVPDEVIEAGEQIVNKLASIFGAFGVLPEDGDKK